MKYIIPFITCFLMLVACTKESDYSAPEGTIYTPRKNAFRATKISGTSTHWGNFTLYLEYDKEELNSIIRTNTQGDTVRHRTRYRVYHLFAARLRAYRRQRLDQPFGCQSGSPIWKR